MILRKKKKKKYCPKRPSLASYPLQAAGFKITVAFLSCSCGAMS